jgi:hypothetical protein
MANKITVMTCCILLAVSVLGFTYGQQGPAPNILANQRANEKATFDAHQAIYNDKANKQIRAKSLVDKKKETDQQEKNKVEKTQDKTKGQLLWKF